MSSEFKQMEILVSAVTSLTNNQFELLDSIRAIGARIDLLVERVNVLETRAGEIEAIQTYSDEDVDIQLTEGDARAEWDAMMRRMVNTVHKTERRRD
jgi:hypothetical protein